jgi:cytochrome c biogenesis protein CcdA
MFYQISLIAAFIAGMVALFAPCCISYLFPAYLGNIFKEKKRVLLMTLIYSLGIFVVLMPIVLGAQALATMFFKLHNFTYLVGSVFLILVAFLSLLGLKLPMPHFTYHTKPGKPDFVSTFTLGLFAGITSACCAPVLLGVIALSSLTPTIALALGVGAVYVLGMVTPLYLAALVVDKFNLLERPLLKTKLTEIVLGKRTYPVFVSNFIAFIIFLVTGLLMMLLTLQGKLGMSVAESAVTKKINQVAFQITSLTDNPLLNLAFFLVACYLIYRFIKRALK